jgi:hypothetical protein
MGDSYNQSRWFNKLSRRTAILKGKKTSSKGTHSELSVLAHLTKKGYWVAKSLDPHCPFDIVSVDRNGKIELIDVKTISYRKRKNGKILKNKTKGTYKVHRSPTKEQKKLNIRLWMVDYEE